MTYLKLLFDTAVEQDPRKAPKGKLPFLIIKDESGAERKLADSDLILEYLDEISQGKLYKGLTPEEKAKGLAFSRLAEDHLYWLIVASRWLDDDWFPHVVTGFFSEVPGILRGFVAKGARKQVATTLNLHGLGRHTLEEQKAFARRDLQAIADAVVHNHHIVGGRLTVYDFVIAAMLSGLLDNEPATWMSKIGNGYPSLRQYLERIQKEVGVSGK